MSRDFNFFHWTDRQRTDDRWTNRLLNPASHMHMQSVYDCIPSLKLCTCMVRSCPVSLSHAACMNGGGREEGGRRSGEGLITSCSY